MELNPNKYRYIEKNIRASILNVQCKSTYEICIELSVAYHIPIVAILLIYQKYISKNNEFEDKIKMLTEFYKYDKIIELEDEL